MVRNLVPGFLGFWERAREEPRERQVELWEEYAAGQPEVVNDVTRSGGKPDPQEALERYPALEERIRQNAPLAVGWIEEAAALVEPVLDGGHLEVPCVAMVGLAGSNGWVTQVDGEHTLFLAVEQIPDRTAARIVATHEFAHALQPPLPEEPWPEDGALGLGIYSEGFATALTAELLPEYGLAEHLWFGPGYEDWLAECERILPEVRVAVLADLESGNQQLIDRYLRLGRGNGLPDRIGYLVGTRAIEKLRGTYDWPELARWSTARAMAEIRQVLDS